LFWRNIFAQEHPPAKSAPAGNGAAAPPAVVITPESTPMDLAKAAFAAQGGEKFRKVQNMMLRGSVSAVSAEQSAVDSRRVLNRDCER
jgi:hypothetical protein